MPGFQLVMNTVLMAWTNRALDNLFLEGVWNYFPLFWVNFFHFVEEKFILSPQSHGDHGGISQRPARQMAGRPAQVNMEKTGCSKPAPEVEAAKPSKLAFGAFTSCAPCCRTLPVSQSVWAGKNRRLFGLGVQRRSQTTKNKKQIKGSSGTGTADEPSIL